MQKKRGPVPGQPLRRVTVYIDGNLIEWGKHQPGGFSLWARTQLEVAMRNGGSASTGSITEASEHEDISESGKERTTLNLPPAVAEWGKEQPGGLSAMLRRMLREAMASSA